MRQLKWTGGPTCIWETQEEIDERKRQETLEYTREWYKNNKEYKLESNRERSQRHKESVKEYLKALPLEIRERLLWDSHFAPGTGKRDFNEPMIVNEFRKLGYAVEYNGSPLPDLTIFKDGIPLFHVEVKRYGIKSPTPEQIEEFDKLELDWYVARTLEDVHTIIGKVQSYGKDRARRTRISDF